MSTPTDSDGILTETAGREQAAAEARLEAARISQADTPKVGVTWEQDSNRPDFKSPNAHPEYNASQILALAVGVATSGETSSVTIARATAYKGWINS